MANQCSKCGGLFLGTEDHSLVCPAVTVIEHGTYMAEEPLSETHQLRVVVAAANDAFKGNDIEAAEELIIQAGRIAAQRKERKPNLINRRAI